GRDVSWPGFACGHISVRLWVLHPSDVQVRARNTDHPRYQRRPAVTNGHVDGHEHAGAGPHYGRGGRGDGIARRRWTVLAGLGCGTDYCGDHGVCPTENDAFIPANARSY